MQKRWKHGISSELKFWRKYLAHEGAEYNQGYKQRLDPNLPLQDYIVECLDPSLASVSLLDVGAGPLTILGKKWGGGGHQVQISAVDALADEYEKNLKEFNVSPPVLTQKCATEYLSKLFPPASFDVVHAYNTLDHHANVNVLEAIRQMIVVTKIGGHIIMRHIENEAINEGFLGIHQWNFLAQQDDLIIWNREVKTSINIQFSKWIQIIKLDKGPNGQFANVIIRKESALT